MMIGLRGIPDVMGGVEVHVQHLSSKLVSLGCDVSVVVRAPYMTSYKEASWNGIKLIRLWSPKIKSLEALVHSFFGVMAAAFLRPDVLHIHAIGPALMAPLARIFGLNVVVTHHGMDYEREKWGFFGVRILKLGEFLGMRFANQRIAVSKGIAQSVTRRFNVKCATIENGVNVIPAASGTDILEKFKVDRRRYILQVGRIVPEKRQLDLIVAFRKAHLEGWKLVLTGQADHESEYSSLVKMAADATPGVIMTGKLLGQDLSQIYSHAGFFVLPSSHEGLPIALLEALSYGLPALASDIGANREVELEQDAYFPVSKVETLAAKLVAYANKDFDDATREKSREKVKRLYNWSDVANKTYAVYRSDMRTDWKYREATSG